uniref:Uncharacterized protein n=1 Tax=Glossina palpalis gambiensis TaxID=67801 RepID=A0A1B0B4F6_9MUSC
MIALAGTAAAAAAAAAVDLCIEHIIAQNIFKQTDRRKTCKNKLSSKKHTAAQYHHHHHHHHHHQQHYHHQHSAPSPLITITEHNLQMVSGTRLMFSAL